MSEISMKTTDVLTNGNLGTFDVACPLCGPSRRSIYNQKRPVLRVWRSERNAASYYCIRCGIKGAARERVSKTSGAREQARSTQQTNADRSRVSEQLRKAKYLCSRLRPADGTLVDTYLRQTRAFSGPIPNSIGYLPPSKPEHHPAMIAIFAWPIDERDPGVLRIPDKSVYGIHLTLLRPDGLGKAGTERDKLMVGRSIGAPIVLAPMNSLQGLVICEGIETGLSLLDATGCGVWVAGSASRMPALADAIPQYTDIVTVAGEPDKPGRKHAFELAERIRKRDIYSEVRFLSEYEAST